MPLSRLRRGPSTPATEDAPSPGRDPEPAVAGASPLRFLMLGLVLAMGLGTGLALAVLGLGSPVAGPLRLAGSGARAPAPGGTASAGRGRVAVRLGHLPLSFEPAAGPGRGRSPARFVSEGAGFGIVFTRRYAEMTVASRRSPAGQPGGRPGRTSTVRVALAGTSPRLALVGRRRLAGKVNVLLGSNPSAWRRGIPTFSGVEYLNAWPGVNAIFHGNQRRLEYDFRVAPHADPGRIQLRLVAAGRIEVDRGGNLVLPIGGGTMRQLRPVSYQLIDGKRHSVSTRYVRLANGSFGVSVGRFDHRRALIIDPVLSYSTYLGGSGNDVAEEIAVDSAGNAYVAGTTYSPNFPTSSTAVQRSPRGVSNIFVAKLDPTGSHLVFSTYLGGSYYDENAGVGVDGQGNVYVAGQTDSPDFPTTTDALQPHDPALDYNHAFFSELSPDGSKLVYSTYLGGTHTDRAGALFVSSDGTAYLTGDTRSTDFPTVNAMQPANAGGYLDAFVTKITPAHQLGYSTYLGGSGDDEGGAIAADGTGNVYVTGATSSDDFHTKAPIQGWAGGFDAFVAKLDPGGALVYSTYLGGRGDDTGAGIGVDGQGSAIVVGQTVSTDFPVKNALQPTNKGGHDAFIAKLAPDGHSLVYSTYLGGSGDDHAGAVAVDGPGNAYMTGNTSSTDFPTLNPISATKHGSQDAFVVKVTPAGALAYSTYLGGGAINSGNSIATDGAGHAYVAGETTSTDFPTKNPAQASSGGADDAFVAELSDTSADSGPPTTQPPPTQPPPTQPPPTQPPPSQPPPAQAPVASFTISPGSPVVGQPVSFDASGSTGSIVSYSWWFDDGAGGSGVAAQHTYSVAGGYTAILTVTDSSGRTSRTGRSFTVGAAQQPPPNQPPPNQPPPNQPPPNQPPPNQPPAAAFVFSPTSPGVGQLVSFDASGSSGSLLSYSWWFDDGSTGSGVKAQHAYATAGAYSPVLTITDGSGQTSRTGRSLTVSAQQPPPNQPPPNQPPPNQPPPNQPPAGQGPVASFKFSPGSPAVGQPVSFDASGSTGSIVSYSWWFDDGGGGSGVTAQHTYGFPGSYTVILTVTDSSGRSSHVGGSFTVH